LAVPPSHRQPYSGDLTAPHTRLNRNYRKGQKAAPQWRGLLL
jgi:hypothetical protein